MANKFDGIGKRLEVVFYLRGPLVREVCKLIILSLERCKTRATISFDPNIQDRLV